VSVQNLRQTFVQVSLKPARSSDSSLLHVVLTSPIQFHGYGRSKSKTKILPSNRSLSHNVNNIPPLLFIFGVKILNRDLAAMQG
jgi:hypothetical protein